jgi:hypothetical protein
MIYERILDTVGNTVVKLHRIPPKHVTIYEDRSIQPAVSVKDWLAS